MKTQIPTTRQGYYLRALARGLEVPSFTVNASTKRAMLSSGWVTDDGDDLCLTPQGRAAIEEG